jgi:hypothetical protein
MKLRLLIPVLLLLHFLLLPLAASAQVIHIPEAVVYADLRSPVVRPFADLDERVSVCGYYALAAVEPQAEEVVLTLGQPLDI